MRTQGDEMTGSTPTRRQLLRGIGISSAAVFAGSTPRTSSASTVSSSTSSFAASEKATLERRARAFVTHVAAGEYEMARTHFSKTLAEQVNPPALRTLWTQLQGEDGSFVTIESTEYRTVEGFDAIVLSLRFTEGFQGLRVVFDDQRRIAGFQVTAPDDDTSRVHRYECLRGSVTADSSIR